MGLHVMTHVHLLLLLCSSLSSAAPVSKSLVVLVRSPVSEQLGRETTLPCWLNPPQSAEALEVRWYRNDHFDTPIILYQNKKMAQESSYVGRASFGLKDAASGGLAAGDVSMKLLNVGIEDEGDYTCYVSSDQGYDRGSVTLKVTETGNTPLLSMVGAEENLVNLSCESEGWYPRPKLHWADHKHNLTPKSLEYGKVSSGLVSVHSWLLVPSSSEVSCSVGLSDMDTKEARVRLEIPPPAAKKVSGLVPGLVVFIRILLAALALLGWLYIKKRVLRKKDKPESNQAEENMKLLQEVSVEKAALEEAKKHYVNIELEDKGNPYLTIKDGMLRDKKHPDLKAVTCLTAIRGTPGFTSGQHYWEVSLGHPGVEVKQSWWVGVTMATDFPLQADALSSTSNGFWFLSSSPDRADSFQLNTEPKVLLPVRSRPRTVGVYLNYDGGELSFYNVEDESVIGSFTAPFQGDVFPFFNPGIGDPGPMKILKRTEQGECNDTGNNERAQEPES
ncbi:butyrophilin subfamily 1 member A1 [Hippoglossus stenolepis]|uniref:butyrophilin subfamily 1 member A1 n=1 Tax=Hippoglossus stenolepis TaxID=195615 RepID=UPI001FAF69AC|nr:butyrophilin subfamily 1 member A1 [Hippoglossus stenolepis]